jgi:isocitrate/isopropylmalate dehydrogenase
MPFYLVRLATQNTITILRPKIRPEQGLLKLRKELGLFANIRPVKAYKTLLKNRRFGKKSSREPILVFTES